MSRGIDLYGQEVAELKRGEKLAEELADRLNLPEDIVLGEASVKLTAGRKALIENHRGILEYGTERIVVATARGKISVSGRELLLVAMNKNELLIGGRIQMLEWE